MSVWFPSAYLKKVLPRNFENQRLLYDDFSVKKTLVRSLVRAEVVNGREINETIYKVIQQYQQKADALEEAGIRAFKKEALNGEALLKMRVKNLLVYAEVQRIKEERLGDPYIWLPSSALNPRADHQLFYGETHFVGDGVFPGEDPGCDCGARFLN